MFHILYTNVWKHRNTFELFIAIEKNSTISLSKKISTYLHEIAHNNIIYYYIVSLNESRNSIESIPLTAIAKWPFVSK